AIDAIVIEHHNADRQLVPTDRLHLHAGKAERAVALDREHRLAGLDRRGDCEAHADTHYTPGADIEALARLVHVNDAARLVERVGTLVHQDRVRPLLDHVAQHTQRGVVVHWDRIFPEPCRHARDVLFFLGIDRLRP